MKVFSGKCVLLIPLIVILISNSFVLVFIPFNSFSLFEMLGVCISILLLDVFWLFLGLRPYKTFDLKEDTLDISYSFSKIFNPVLFSSIKEIAEIKIVKYAMQGKIPPVMYISYFHTKTVKKKRIFFRVGDKKREFQVLIDTLRTKGVKIECEGDVWF